MLYFFSPFVLLSKASWKKDALSPTRPYQLSWELATAVNSSLSVPLAIMKWSRERSSAKNNYTSTEPESSRYSINAN